MITLDVSRTYQDKELFQSNHIKEMLINILFIWSKDNKEVSYKQGMNEILAVILLAIYPFYITDNHFSNNPNSLKTKIRKLNEEKDYLSISRELFTFVNCESYLQADLFILFNAIMSRGIVSLYNTENDERRINEEFSGVPKILI
jgi:TBC1 domain family protein 5